MANTLVQDLIEAASTGPEGQFVEPQDGYVYGRQLTASTSSTSRTVSLLLAGQFIAKPSPMAADARRRHPASAKSVATRAADVGMHYVTDAAGLAAR